ncbi:MAG: glutamate--tRNA ligase [Acidimicrobiia bacterium]|nr:glutamate--tRNA ligase [Acidimicrobiia bacterium]NNL27931.1 glutamate--tRNA ligase [Acidimicrobiia bacterium]
MRARFAPSPTGYLHVGGARTALYNYLAVRATGGEFILRSDDTDTERSSGEFQNDILDGMRWLGLEWDEGIEKGGPHSPYRQSERLARYQEVARSLLDLGKAYLCFATAAELDEMRDVAKAEGRPPGYDGRYRDYDSEQARKRLDGGEDAVIRLKVPRPGETVFEDLVRGEVRFNHDHVEDFIILRSNQTPTYHLASSVDDVDFGITHVIRGEDLLSSTPKHILIGEALEAAPIAYAHLSLLMGPDGKKLSKRHGDTSLRAYREAGYLSEAMTNYLALLGWSFGEDSDIFTLEEAVARFSLDAVQPNAAIFDNDKLEWMNGVYIRAMSDDEFADRVAPLITAEYGELNELQHVRLRMILPHVKERAKLLNEVPGQVGFLMTDDIDYDRGSWDKVMTAPEAKMAVEDGLERLSNLDRWDAESIEGELRAMLEHLQLNGRKGLQPIRVAISGSTISPPLFESMEALGQAETVVRTSRALDLLLESGANLGDS